MQVISLRIYPKKPRKSASPLGIVGQIGDNTDGFATLSMLGLSRDREIKGKTFFITQSSKYICYACLLYCLFCAPSRFFLGIREFIDRLPAWLVATSHSCCRNAEMPKSHTVLTYHPNFHEGPPRGLQQVGGPLVRWLGRGHSHP